MPRTVVLFLTYIFYTFSRVWMCASARTREKRDILFRAVHIEIKSGVKLKRFLPFPYWKRSMDSVSPDTVFFSPILVNVFRYACFVGGIFWNYARFF